ncbi:hypothetical protein UT300012_39780 [Paraclostridium bifermentans]
MSINNVTINNVESELKTIKKNILKLKAWEKEIEVIESKLNSYIENKLGFKSQGSFDLSKIIENDQARMNILKSNIEYTVYSIEKIKSCMICLESEEKKVIELKYLDSDMKSISLRAIGGILNCSKDAVNKLLKSAIAKIVEYKNETNIKDIRQ